jgi:hypothetical protein
MAELEDRIDIEQPENFPFLLTVQVAVEKRHFTFARRRRGVASDIEKVRTTLTSCGNTVA